MDKLVRCVDFQMRKMHYDSFLALSYFRLDELVAMSFMGDDGKLQIRLRRRIRDYAKFTFIYYHEFPKIKDTTLFIYSAMIKNISE